MATNTACNLGMKGYAIGMHVSFSGSNTATLRARERSAFIGARQMLLQLTRRKKTASRKLFKIIIGELTI